MSGEYTFCLNKIHCNSKRGNDDYVDNDFVVFMVIVNGDIYSAPASTPPAVGAIGLVKNGDDIPIGDKAPLDAAWRVGPLTINDQDVVAVIYTISNFGFEQPGAAAAEALKVEAGVLGSAAAILGVVAAALTPSVFGTIVAGASAIVLGAASAILGVVGEIIGWLGSERPNCDGPIVISPPITFTGAELDQKVNIPVSDQPSQFTFTFLNKHLTQPSPAGCWTPDTDVTWSALRDTSHQFLPLRPTSFRTLAASHSPKDWEATGGWGDGTYVEDSRIRCTIRASGNGVMGTSPTERMQSYIAGLRHTAAAKPRGLNLLGASAHTIRSSGLAIAARPPVSVETSSQEIAHPQTSQATHRGGDLDLHLSSSKNLIGQSRISDLQSSPQDAKRASLAARGDAVLAVSARYHVDVTEHFDSSGGPVAEQFTVEDLVEIPMMSDSFTSNVYPSKQTVRHLATSGDTGTDVAKNSKMALSPLVTETKHAALRQQSAAGTPGDRHAVPVRMAATLAASAAVSLELFAHFDDTGVVVDHCVRYVRTDTHGHVVADVMLHPVQNVPR